MCLLDSEPNGTIDLSCSRQPLRCARLNGERGEIEEQKATLARCVQHESGSSEGDAIDADGCQVAQLWRARDSRGGEEDRRKERTSSGLARMEWRRDMETQMKKGGGSAKRKRLDSGCRCITLPGRHGCWSRVCVSRNTQTDSGPCELRRRAKCEIRPALTLCVAHLISFEESTSERHCVGQRVRDPSLVRPCSRARRLIPLDRLP